MAHFVFECNKEDYLSNTLSMTHVNKIPLWEQSDCQSSQDGRTFQADGDR
jgi:hypothetical protein